MEHSAGDWLTGRCRRRPKTGPRLSASLNGRQQAVPFVPIQLEEYVRLHLRSNPGASAVDVTARLQCALEVYKAGRRCHCGAPIWVIGSAEIGLMCFTCITGEAGPSGDYEIAGACDKSDA